MFGDKASEYLWYLQKNQKSMSREGQGQPSRQSNRTWAPAFLSTDFTVTTLFVGVQWRSTLAPPAMWCAKHVILLYMTDCTF